MFLLARKVSSIFVCLGVSNLLMLHAVVRSIHAPFVFRLAGKMSYEASLTAGQFSTTDGTSQYEKGGFLNIVLLGKISKCFVR